jgi:hypothetical protein
MRRNQDSQRDLTRLLISALDVPKHMTETHHVSRKRCCSALIADAQASAIRSASATDSDLNVVRADAKSHGKGSLCLGNRQPP